MKDLDRRVSEKSDEIIALIEGIESATLENLDSPSEGKDSLTGSHTSQDHTRGLPGNGSWSDWSNWSAWGK